MPVGTKMIAPGGRNKKEMFMAKSFAESHKDPNRNPSFKAASQHSISSVDLGLQHFASLRLLQFFLSTATYPN